MASAHDTFDSASTQTLAAYSAAWADAFNSSLAEVHGTSKDVCMFAGADQTAARYTGATFGADQFAQIRVTALPVSDRWIGVGVRLTAGGGYVFMVRHDQWYLYQWDGSFTYINNGTRTQSIGDVVRLEVTGTGATVSLTAKINGTTIATFDDTSGNRKLSGAPGVAGYSLSGSEARGDAWVGGDLGSVATITRTIGNGTRNHANLAAFASWAAAHYPNLVTADVILRGEVYAEGGGTNGEYVSSGSVSFGAVTCDATRFIEIVAAAGQGFNEHANKLTNALRYNPANGVALRFTGNYNYGFESTGGTTPRIKLRGLQIKTDSVLCVGFDHNSFDQCVIEAGWSGNIMQSTGYYLTNCLVRATSATGAPVGGTVFNGTFIGCTFIGSGATYAFNFSNYASGNIVRNCAIFGFSYLCPNTARFNGAACTNNATSMPSANFGVGSANIFDLSASATFENTGAGTEDYRIKAGAAVIGAGIRDASYTNDLDILGQARSTTTPTIGAFEYLTANPTLSLPGVQDITSTSARPTVTLTY